MLKSVLLPISNAHGELAVAGPKLSPLSNLLPWNTRTIFFSREDNESQTSLRFRNNGSLTLIKKYPNRSVKKYSEIPSLCNCSNLLTCTVCSLGLMFLYGGACSMDKFILRLMLLIVCSVLSTTLYFNQVYCKAALQVTGHKVKIFWIFKICRNARQVKATMTPFKEGRQLFTLWTTVTTELHCKKTIVE